jgi:hypothetical protein
LFKAHIKFRVSKDAQIIRFKERIMSLENQVRTPQEENERYVRLANKKRLKKS